MIPSLYEIREAVKWFYGVSDRQVNAIVNTKSASSLIKIWEVWKDHCKKAFYND